MAIKKISKIIHISNIHSNEISCITYLKDKRIATGSLDNSISIISFNFDNLVWKIEIYKENAHEQWIYSLCELNNNKLASSSEPQDSIKLWLITPIDLVLIKTLKGHEDTVSCIIPLYNNRFASCSGDSTVKIWENEEPFQEITSLKHTDSVWSIFQLKQKQILISSVYSGDYSTRVLCFWDVVVYQQEHLIKGDCAIYPTHMIELQNGDIAISSNTGGALIVIINTNKYCVVSKIKLDGYIIHPSSLCLWENDSFIYVYKGIIVQISSIDYSIISKFKNNDEIYGYNGIADIEKGKLLGFVNESFGISILNFC